MTPRLTESLPVATELYRCQRCSGTVELARWMECDDKDQPDHRLLVLCRQCSDKIIEPHPRLYHELHGWHPWPGAMAVCRDCALRTGVRCGHSKAQQNGGNGVELTYPEPVVMFMDGSDPETGRRWGRKEVRWLGPVTACAGKVPA